MKKIIFKGSGVALVTPMNADSTINYDVLGNLIEFHIKNKTDAIISCGTTGESATLSPEEHYNIIKYTAQKVAGRIPVIAGTGSNNTQHALDLSLEAEKLGVDGLLIVTPYYNKTSQIGLVKHYNYIADRVKTPIILYNVPSRTGMSIKPDTYLELSKHPNIVAVKEASGDISCLAKTVSLCSDDLMVYSGNDDQIVPILSLGGIGVISVLANVMPQQTHAIVTQYLKGDTENSRSIQLKLLDLIEALFSDVNPIPVKKAMNLIGFNCGQCRLPLAQMGTDNRLRLKVAMQKHGLIEKSISEAF